MQTFLMYRAPSRTMRDLDQARLGKQRLETLQILRMLRGDVDGGAWMRHPAVRMWEGYEPALVLYGLFCVHEWRIVRGHSDTMWGDFAKLAAEYGMLKVDERCYAANEIDDVEAPPWTEDRWVMRSHRSRLIEKAPHIYEDKYPGTPYNMPYLWPLVDLKTGEYTLNISKADVARLEKGERELPEGLTVHGQLVAVA